MLVAVAEKAANATRATSSDTALAAREGRIAYYLAVRPAKRGPCRNASLLGGVRSCGREEGNGMITRSRKGAERKMRRASSWPGVAILPMTFHGRPARPAQGGVLRQAGTPVPRRKLCGFRPEQDPFPPISGWLRPARRPRQACKTGGGTARAGSALGGSARDSPTPNSWRQYGQTFRESPDEKGY
jgi:hypothetical protein